MLAHPRSGVLILSGAPNPYLYTLEPSISSRDALARLASMPTDLRALVANKDLLRPRADGEWTAFQTLLHVRDATFIYAMRFRWMVFDNDPPLTNYDENNWVEAARDGPEDIPEILGEISASRSDLMRVLTRLPADHWQRTGRHEVAGTIVLEHYVRHQVAHEAMHLEQIRAALD